MSRIIVASDEFFKHEDYYFNLAEKGENVLIRHESDQLLQIIPIAEEDIHDLDENDSFNDAN